MKMKRTHKGLMFGIVPVWLDMTIEDQPAVEARYYVFDPVLDVAEFIFGLCVFMRSSFDPSYEPMYPITITGEL